MKININEKFVVIADEDQYTLYERMITGKKKIDGKPTKNEGKERLQTIGYFSTLPGAVKKVVRIELGRRRETITLRAYIDAFRDLLMRYSLILELPAKK